MSLQIVVEARSSCFGLDVFNGTVFYRYEISMHCNCIGCLCWWHYLILSPSHWNVHKCFVGDIENDYFSPCMDWIFRWWSTWALILFSRVIRLLHCHEICSTTFCLRVTQEFVSVDLALCICPIVIKKIQYIGVVTLTSNYDEGHGVWIEHFES